MFVPAFPFGANRRNVERMAALGAFAFVVQPCQFVIAVNAEPVSGRLEAVHLQAVIHQVRRDRNTHHQQETMRHHKLNPGMIQRQHPWRNQECRDPWDGDPHRSIKDPAGKDILRRRLLTPGQPAKSRGLP